METKNKIALVTGGNRGLGKDMAIALAAKGIDVIVTYNTNEDEANKVVSAITATGRRSAALQLDLSKPGTIDTFASALKKILHEKWQTTSLDFLVNNAGIGATIPIAQVTEEAFDNLMNIHFKGVFFLTQKLLPQINDNGGVIFISSGTTRFCVHGYAVYSSLKSAIETFTKYVAKEMGPRGIRANVVAPGPVETDFNNAAIRNNPQMKGFLQGQTALGRVGRADDIGSVVAFLCTEDAKWINGQKIDVNGGINL